MKLVIEVKMATHLNALLFTIQRIKRENRQRRMVLAKLSGNRRKILLLTIVVTMTLCCQSVIRNPRQL